MTYHLTGYPAILVFLLAWLGAINILDGISSWVLERISIDLHPLWHVIPRRFRVSIRWDRPGGIVSLSDGSGGVILATYECDDAPCPVALVQCCDEDENLGPAEWLPVTALLPLPASAGEQEAGTA